jgi:SAM-dependent methyltransferase
MSEFWDNRFRAAGDAFVFGREPSQFVVRMAARLNPGSRILLPADGEGRNSCYLASLGHDVHACDYSEAGLAKARALAAELGVTVSYRLADVEKMEWPDGGFDAVFGVFIQFSPPPARARVFNGMKTALKPGGTIYLHGYTPKQLDYRTGGPSAVENLYAPEMLRAAFADCTITTLSEYEMDLAEGAGHSGRSALIDLVAVKG